MALCHEQPYFAKVAPKTKSEVFIIATTTKKKNKILCFIAGNRHKVSIGVQSQPQLVFGTGPMIPSIPVSVPISGDIVHQTNAIVQSSGIITTPTAAIPGFSIANPNVLFQQYPPLTTPHQIPKSQMNTSYHYHTQAVPINNRASILTTHTTTTAQQAATSYRMPT